MWRSATIEFAATIAATLLVASCGSSGKTGLAPPGPAAAEQDLPDEAGAAVSGVFDVLPLVRDPGDTSSVKADWRAEAGLPDGAGSEQGLILEKTSQTGADAEAGARVLGVNGLAALTTLGFDYRSAGHCTAGSPRLAVARSDGATQTYGCAGGVHSPAPDRPATWTRVRFNVPALPAGVVIRRVAIRFTEGPGAATLDNVAVNAALVGKPGPRIYIADGHSERIVRILDIAGTGWTAIGKYGQRGGMFLTGVSGVTLDRAGHIYVADRGNSRVVRVKDMTGAGWRTFGHCTDLPCTGVGDLRSPRAVAADESGRLYIADTNNMRIVRIRDFMGAGWTTLGTPYEGPFAGPCRDGVREFCYPTGLALDAPGRIYVADQANDRIVRVNDMSGAGWTTCCSGAHEFDDPTGLTVDAAGRIYVADALHHRVVRINDMRGTGWTSFGVRSTRCNEFEGGSGGTGRFCFPTGVAVDDTGRIYVVDSRNSRLVRINDMSGAGWTTLWNGFGDGVGQFAFPLGIFISR